MRNTFYVNNKVSQDGAEAVSVAELRGHLRLDTEDDDTQLARMIEAARLIIESETSLALTTQTWDFFLDDFPVSREKDWWDGVREGAITSEKSRYIVLPIAPLASVTQISTFDQSDNETVFSSANYYVDTNRRPGRVALRAGATWPVWTRETNGFKCTYTAGYGSAATDVPADLRQAVLMVASDYYENRDSVVIGAISAKIGSLIEPILARHKMRRL